MWRAKGSVVRWKQPHGVWLIVRGRTRHQRDILAAELARLLNETKARPATEITPPHPRKSNP
jgi:hypothetical protein